MIRRKFLHKSLCALALLCTHVSEASELPGILATSFVANKPISAEVVAVVPPAEFEIFVQKLSAVSKESPEWFAEHLKKTPGSPMPSYDPKLGMTQEEYDSYTKLWGNRETKALENISLIVREVQPGKWNISGTGVASVLSLLVFDSESGNFTSPNGEMKRIGDINAPEQSLLGAWNGYEWRCQLETTLTKMKENLAFGTSEDGKYCMLIYRLQEVTARGNPLLDESIVIRFANGK